MIDPPPLRPPSRPAVDLRRLPVVPRYALATAVIAVVAGAAWWTGRDRPPPAWVLTRLAPALGVLYLVLVVVAILGRRPRRR